MILLLLLWRHTLIHDEQEEIVNLHEKIKERKKFSRCEKRNKVVFFSRKALNQSVKQRKFFYNLICFPSRLIV